MAFVSGIFESLKNTDLSTCFPENLANRCFPKKNQSQSQEFLPQKKWPFITSPAVPGKATLSGFHTLLRAQQASTIKNFMFSSFHFSFFLHSCFVFLPSLFLFTFLSFCSPFSLFCSPFFFVHLSLFFVHLSLFFCSLFFF